MTVPRTELGGGVAAFAVLAAGDAATGARFAAGASLVFVTATGLVAGLAFGAAFPDVCLTTAVFALVPDVFAAVVLFAVPFLAAVAFGAFLLAAGFFIETGALAPAVFVVTASFLEVVVELGTLTALVFVAVTTFAAGFFVAVFFADDLVAGVLVVFVVFVVNL
jgi:hypothetical protein